MALGMKFLFLVILQMGSAYKYGGNMAQVTTETDELVIVHNSLIRILHWENSTLHCAGVITSRLFLMTSCSCIGFISDNKMVVLLKESRFYISRGSQSDFAGSCEKFLPYDLCGAGYKEGIYAYDLAAIRLDNPFIFDELARPIKSPEYRYRDLKIVFEDMVENNTLCDVYAWDFNTSQYISPPVNSPLLSGRLCQQEYCSGQASKDCPKFFVENDIRCLKSPKNYSEIDGVQFRGSPVICNGTLWGISSVSVKSLVVFTSLDNTYDFYNSLIILSSAINLLPVKFVLIFSCVLYFTITHGINKIIY